MFHVLVVEDELLIRDAIVEMINEAGEEYTVIGEASSGKEAWVMIQELWPTILVTDIQMPDCTGLDLIRKIRENELPIVCIVISGYDLFEYAQNAIRYGVSEYLLKPISEEELSKALECSLKQLVKVHEPNQILLDMQKYLEEMHKTDQLELLKRGDEIVHSILSNRTINSGAKVSFLKIFWGRLHECIKAICPEYENKSFQEVKVNNTIRQSFRQLIYDWIRNYPNYKNNNNRFVIKEACTYIRNNYMESITQKEMADYCYLSVSYFGVLFKQYTGKTFINYLNYVRIEKARELLENPNLKIYEVSERVGFLTLPYFNRVFKNVIDITPNEYRKSIGI